MTNNIIPTQSECNRKLPPPRIRGEGAKRRLLQSLEDKIRTPIQVQAANGGRAKANQKHRRSEAWWQARWGTWEIKVFTREFLSRAIREHLTATEWAVLDFIYDRTLQWDKLWETIRMKQFVHGSLPDENGYRAFCGCGLGERAVRNACRSLEEWGLIQIREKANGNGLLEYSITPVDKIAKAVEAREFSDGRSICYRAKWPGTDTVLEIRSKNAKG